MDCTVLDISEMGVRLKPIEYWSLPDGFEPNLLCDAKHRRYIVHKRGDQLGVRFA